jgi:hypothetical protein
VKFFAVRFHRAAILAGSVALVILAGSALALPPGEKPAPDVFSRLEDAGMATDHDGADHLVVFTEAVNKVKPSGVTYVDGYELTKVLTPEGCRDQSVLTWHYDPQSSHVEVREVNIVRDGELIPIDLTAVHDLPAPQAAIYWNDRIKTLQLPRLRVNDGIEVKIFRKGFTYALLTQGDGGSGGAAADPDDERYIPPMPGEYFDIVLFTGAAPILEKRYVLRLPADKRLHAEVYNGALYSSVTYDDEITEYAWWGLDLPAQIHESRQPSGSEEKVDEILKDQGLTRADEERKAKALLHWVAQNIRYSGQTMGEGEGFTLHSGEMIFEQRSGVCKDIAGMLVTMMRAAGMDSYAAMTMAGSRIDEVPADQFNHCVTALKLEDGTFRMYDPTWVPFNNDIWSLLETEQHYLVGSPEGETLSRIRYSPPAESPLKVTHEAMLDKEGALTGTFRFEGTGAMDSRLRRLVNGTRKMDLNLRCARLLNPVSRRVGDIQARHHPVDDFSGDMWLEFEYRIPAFVRPVAGGFEFTSPLMQMVLGDRNLFGSGGTHWAEERETDLLLWYTQLLDGAETIRVPGGYELTDPPEVEDVDEEYASFSGSVEQKGSKLVLTHRAEVKRRQIPPDGYSGFRKAMEAARNWGDEIYRIEKGGK